MSPVPGDLFNFVAAKKSYVQVEFTLEINKETLTIPHSVNLGLISSHSLDDLTLVDASLRSIFTRVGHLLNTTPHTITILAADANGREVKVLSDILAS
ncbi:MAG TPA: hypothetical protein VMW63_04675 [Methanoregulaceae archaeon]|nr:hypothetical protein [Methanoregulaceae archaeon]